MILRLDRSTGVGLQASIFHPDSSASSEPGRRLKVQGGAIVTATSTSKAQVTGEIRPEFLTDYSHFQRVQDDVERLPAVGANIIQIEIGPLQILTSPGIVDPKSLDALLVLLDRPAEAGVAVDIHLSPHDFPAWMLDRVPELRRHRKGFVQYCVHHPAGRKFLRQ